MDPYKNIPILISRSFIEAHDLLYLDQEKLCDYVPKIKKSYIIIMYEQMLATPYLIQSKRFFELCGLIAGDRKPLNRITSRSMVFRGPRPAEPYSLRIDRKAFLLLGSYWTGLQPIEQHKVSLIYKDDHDNLDEIQKMLCFVPEEHRYKDIL